MTARPGVRSAAQLDRRGLLRAAAAGAAASVLGSAPATARGATAAAEAVEAAHAEIWRRFVDPHGVLLDYCDLDGSIVRPTPEDCRQLKPSALSWGVPIEDGPLFNGLYLDGLCRRWRRTGAERDRARARRMTEGLLFLASVGNTPGFIARGVATDGKTTYPMGSNDQTMPWLYGLWRYLRDDVATAEERGPLVERLVGQLRTLDEHGWRMPCDGPPSRYRGSFAIHSWEGAPRLLFCLKALHHLTGEAAWQQRYEQAALEPGGERGRTRLDFCRAGLVFDPRQGPRHSWTGSIGVAALRALWELETDAAWREAYAAGLRSSAALVAPSLALGLQFDPLGKERFEHDWRVMNGAWKPQHGEADAVAVAEAGLRLQHRASPRLHLEKDLVREPCFAAWIVTLCPDRQVVATHAPAIEALIAHYRYDRLYLSQFFPVESAWFRLADD